MSPVCLWRGRCCTARYPERETFFFLRRVFFLVVAGFAARPSAKVPQFSPTLQPPSQALHARTARTEFLVSHSFRLRSFLPFLFLFPFSPPGCLPPLPSHPLTPPTLAPPQTTPRLANSRQHPTILHEISLIRRWRVLTMPPKEDSPPPVPPPPPNSPVLK